MAPVLATLLIVAGLSVFAWILSFRVRPLLFARPDVRWDDAPTRTEKLLLYGFGQKRMPSKPERPAGAAHIGIFIAFIVAQLGTPARTATHVMTVGVLLHIAIVMAFLNFLPLGKHFHIITGLPTVFFQRLTPQGQLSKLDLENSEKFGVARLTDLSWKEILDTYSCTECGRCQTYCPTYDTGKPLTHKEVNRAIRHHAQQMAAQMPLPLRQLARALDRSATGNGAA